MNWWKFWKRDAPRVRTGYVNASGRDLAAYLTEPEASAFVDAIRSSGRAAHCLDRIIRHFRLSDSIDGDGLQALEKTLAEKAVEPPTRDAIISAVVRWLRRVKVCDNRRATKEAAR